MEGSSSNRILLHFCSVSKTGSSYLCFGIMGTCCKQLYANANLSFWILSNGGCKSQLVDITEPPQFAQGCVRIILTNVSPGAHR